MAAFARTMIRFRWAVLAVWLVLFAVSGAAASGLSDLLTNRFVLPGAESEKTGELLEQHFGQKPEGSFSLVVEGAPGSAQSLVAPAQAAAERAAGALRTGRSVGAQPVSDSVVTARIVSELQPADAKGYTATMREAAGTIPGAQVYVTGQSAIEHDLEPVQNHDLKVGELYIAIPIALLILVFVFGSLAFLLPFMLAALAIPVTLGLVWIFANFMELSTYITNMVALIGLGIAIDYSLLIVYRYREERHGGRSREEAIEQTMETAGRAVVFSGTAVAIGLALMLFDAAPVHARVRPRWAADPARVGAGRGDDPAGAALLARGPARPCPARAEADHRAARRSGQRLLAAARAHDHASAGGVRRGHHDRAAPCGRAAARARARAGVEPGHPAGSPGR